MVKMTVELRGDASARAKDVEVEIHCDREGLEMFIARLVQLKESSAKSDHVHFMTPSWAGDELTESPQGVGTTLVNHLVVMKGG